LPPSRIEAAAAAAVAAVDAEVAALEAEIAAAEAEVAAVEAQQEGQDGEGEEGEAGVTVGPPERPPGAAAGAADGPDKLQPENGDAQQVLSKRPVPSEPAAPEEAQGSAPPAKKYKKVAVPLSFEEDD
jgi:hypothetical protein